MSYFHRYRFIYFESLSIIFNFDLNFVVIFILLKYKHVWNIGFLMTCLIFISKLFYVLSGFCFTWFNFILILESIVFFVDFVCFYFRFNENMFVSFYIIYFIILKEVLSDYCLNEYLKKKRVLDLFGVLLELFARCFVIVYCFCRK